MITYDNASKAQKKWVDAVIAIFPNIATTGIITSKECYSAHMNLLKNRKPDSEKIGYPNWLFKTNKISPGVYFFPAKGLNPDGIVKTIPVGNSSIRAEVSNTEEDKQFFKDILSNGV